MAQTKTVLIVDDEPEIRNLLGEFLRLKGWHVLHAEDGHEGVLIAKTNRPDVVLCDLLMPHGNGFQVCRSLRQLESLKHTKIIMISGRPFENDRQAALNAGADQYLVKPLSLEKLAVLMSRMVASSEETEWWFAPSATAPESGMRLKFWGVRGSVPTPGAGTVEYGGNTTCVEVRVNGQIIILDAGTGLRMLGRSLMDEFGDSPLDLTLLLTHTHWDHIQGLPFFLPVYKPHNRLRILGFEGARNGLASVLTSQMESPVFPVPLGEVPANIRIEELKDLDFQLGQVRVQAFFAFHPGICVGYRLSTPTGSIAFFPDNEIRQEPPTAPGQDSAALEFARNENRKLTQFLAGTDVLIMDSQYDAVEYATHVGWGHGCAEDVVSLALRAGIKRLFLFHHDPDHDDTKVSEMAAHARDLVAEKSGELEVEAAREGAVVEFPLVGKGSEQGAAARG